MVMNALERKAARNDRAYVGLVRDLRDAGIIENNDAIKLLSGDFATYIGPLTPTPAPPPDED